MGMGVVTKESVPFMGLAPDRDDRTLPHARTVRVSGGTSR